jgi:N-ethylmaleimide reductase
VSLEKTEPAILRMNILFTPFTIGDVQLPNRILMAPLTRCRTGLDRVPNDLMVEYYRQRATAGLIITEATIVSPQGAGYVNTPGIYHAEQVRGWQRVTNAVHAEGGWVFLQLWHTGRSSHHEFQPGGAPPVAPSAIAIRGEVHTFTGKHPYPTPRALKMREIPGIVADFANATKLAREAGFDGVEIHAANGYLIDQFLRDGTNQRTDRYGGSVENRARFLLEVTAAVVGAWRPERVGVRLSPTGAFNDMHDSSPSATFGYAAAQLDGLGLAYLHVTEPLAGSPMATELPRVAPLLRRTFTGPFIINGGYDARTGARAIDEGDADLVAYGVPFLTSPDLVERVRSGAPLNPPDVATFYSGGAKGYIDYPTLTEPALV